MRLLFGEPFSSSERETYREIIFVNTIEAMKVGFSIHLHSRLNAGLSRFLLLGSSFCSPSPTSPSSYLPLSHSPQKPSWITQITSHYSSRTTTRVIPWVKQSVYVGRRKRSRKSWGEEMNLDWEIVLLSKSILPYSSRIEHTTYSQANLHDLHCVCDPKICIDHWQSSLPLSVSLPSSPAHHQVTTLPPIKIFSELEFERQVYVKKDSSSGRRIYAYWMLGGKGVRGINGGSVFIHSCDAKEMNWFLIR